MSAAATISGLLREAAARLPASASPRLDAEILLASVLSTERTKLYTRSLDTVGEARRRVYGELIARRAQGCPVGYLIGRSEFWSLDFEVDERVLIPRPETELVVEIALADLGTDAAADIVDVGTGSGAIAVALAHERPRCRVAATDVCASALAVAARNAVRHGCRNVALSRSDWFDAIGARRFDLIVSNPPYVAETDPALRHGEIRFEPERALAAGADGLDALRAIVARAPRYLNDRGRLIVEHGCEQAAAVRALMRGAGLSRVETTRDLAGHERVTSARLAAPA